MKNYLSKSLYNFLILIISIIMALILNLIPMPENLKWLKPNFIALVILYWVIFTPGTFGLYFTFIVGICIDLLTNNLLGSTSLTLLPMVFLGDMFNYRFRAFNLWQQLLVIFSALGITQLI